MFWMSAGLGVDRDWALWAHPLEAFCRRNHLVAVALAVAGLQLVENHGHAAIGEGQDAIPAQVANGKQGSPHFEQICLSGRPIGRVS